MKNTKPNINDHIYYCVHDKTQFAIFECTTITLPELWTVIPIRELASAPAFEEINRILKNVKHGKRTQANPI